MKGPCLATGRREALSEGDAMVEDAGAEEACMIEVRCVCGRVFRVPEAYRGRWLRCRHCGARSQVGSDVVVVEPEIIEPPPPGVRVGGRWAASAAVDRELAAPRGRQGGGGSGAAAGAAAEAVPLAAAGAQRRPWWPWLALLLFFAGLWWLGQHTTSAPEEAAPVEPAAPLADAGPAAPPPDAAPAAAAPACAGGERPRSSAELGGRARGAGGRLVVINGTTYDAVAVLVDADTDEPRRAIYIRQGERGVMTRVPVGVYLLQFQLGDDWIAEEGRFCTVASTEHFEDPLEFDGSGWEVTLHPVVGGTAATEPIPPSAFRLPAP